MIFAVAFILKDLVYKSCLVVFYLVSRYSKFRFRYAYVQDCIPIRFKFSVEHKCLNFAGIRCQREKVTDEVCSKGQNLELISILHLKRHFYTMYSTLLLLFPNIRMCQINVLMLTKRT